MRPALAQLPLLDKSLSRNMAAPETAFINTVALWVGGLYALRPIIPNDNAATVAIQKILQTPAPHYAMASGTYGT